jgi:uncharacterized protein (DUF169 family)
MIDYAQSSRRMKEILGLKYEPVAIKLIRKGEPLPEGYQEPDKRIRHCQSIMRAKRGDCLLVPAEKHACPVGASALGLMPIPEKVASGQFHCNMGMYRDATAAKHTMDVRPKLEPGSLAATLVCPLSKVRLAPDVIVITGTPEQVYWLLPAATSYDEGGRVTIEIAPVQGSCADSTIRPFLTGMPNASFGCVGCRKYTEIAPEEMFIGFPATMLESMVANLERLNEKAIPFCRERSPVQY